MSKDPFNIVNHVDYKEHMKAYLLKTECASLLAQAKKEIIRQQKANSLLQEQVNSMKGVYADALKRCPLPVKPLCPVIPLSQNPEYIAMKKREKELLVKCPSLSEAKEKLHNLEEECTAPPTVCKEAHIKKHSGYPALIEKWRKQMSDMKATLEAECQKRHDTEKSQLEAEMKRKLRTDIRDHPDYKYFKNYYESRIAQLQKTIDGFSCPKQTVCPTCPTLKCPEPKPQAFSVNDSESLTGQDSLRKKQWDNEEPRGFLRTQVPMLNPSGKIGNTYAYDPIEF